MEEQLIKLETANLAKEKGFKKGIHHNGLGQYYTNTTQSLLQKWLREVHKIYVASYHDLNPIHDGIIYYTNWGYINDPSDKKLAYNPLGSYDESTSWRTYEDALEFGLQAALKLINN